MFVFDDVILEVVCAWRQSGVSLSMGSSSIRSRPIKNLTARQVLKIGRAALSTGSRVCASKDR